MLSTFCRAVLTHLAGTVTKRNTKRFTLEVASTPKRNAIRAIWPIGGYNWEPGKVYTYTIDLAGCGYYETNQDTDADLDPILENAEIKFVSVTVDDWTAVAKAVPGS